MMVNKHLWNSKEQQVEIRKPSLAINAKKYRKTTEWEKLEISSQLIQATKPAGVQAPT